MRYVALATDFDGTLAHDGCVPDSTVAALKELAASGRKLLLVTGRELEDLRRTFHSLDLFDWLVVENGAVLHRPANGETRVLAEPPPAAFVAECKRLAKRYGERFKPTKGLLARAQSGETYYASAAPTAARAS